MTKKFIVTTKTGIGETVPLRGTVWAFHMSRAQLFPTKEAAQAGLDKAKQFMKAKTYKSAKIEEVEDHEGSFIVGNTSYPKE